MHQTVSSKLNQDISSFSRDKILYFMYFKYQKLMECYWLFRSAEFLTPLCILKEIRNKIQIMILKHLFDGLNISKQRIAGNYVLNFLYESIMDIYIETQNTIENTLQNVMDWLWNVNLIMLLTVAMVACGMVVMYVFDWFVSSNYGQVYQRSSKEDMPPFVKREEKHGKYGLKACCHKSTAETKKDMFV